MVSTPLGAPVEIDALVVGAGPVGLFQVFQLGLHAVHCHVIDTLPYAGGQCMELYPDKPIYDIPALTVCTGRELTERLLQQVAPFEPRFHFNQHVSSMQAQADGRWLVGTRRGRQFLTKTLFIAAGVGAFLPRTLKVAALEPFEGSQLHYRADNAAHFAGQDVLIVGGDDTAVQHALALCAAHPDSKPGKARSVTLLHRRDALQADPTALATLRTLCDAGHMEFVVGQITGHDEQQGHLNAVRITTVDGTERTLPTDALLVLQGLSPKLGPIAEWGLAMERKQLQVSTETFATSAPGIFAVGDINTYPGKKKLIVCGFHECVLAAFAAMAVIAPNTKVPLEYTTSSARLHALLGVSPAQTQT
jgi:thioredoxin reductase (NADPH)